MIACVELVGPDPEFEKRFGDVAQRALWHRLRADILLKQKGFNRLLTQRAINAEPTPLPGTHVVITGKIPPGATGEDREDAESLRAAAAANPRGPTARGVRH